MGGNSHDLSQARGWDLGCVSSSRTVLLCSDNYKRSGKVGGPNETGSSKREEEEMRMKRVEMKTKISGQRENHHFLDEIVN